MTEDQKLEAPANGNWRPVFIVSDGTAITAETLAHSVLTQFPNLSYDRERIPFIDTVEKAKQTAERINAVQRRTGVRPLVFSTFVDPVISRSFINSNEGFQIELFRSFVGPLEHELCMKSEHTIGATHKIVDEDRYNKRIAAIANEDDASDVIDELVDRYGDVPPSVSGLIDISLVRVTAARLGIYEITQRGDTLLLYCDRYDMRTLRPVLQQMGRRVMLNASGKPYLAVRVEAGEQAVEVMRRALRCLDEGRAGAEKENNET